MTSSSRRCPANKPGLYVHIPFCLSRCGYCTFASSLYDAARADAYLSALAAEIAARGMRGMTFSTLFIGGGTPTALSPAQLSRLFSLLPQVEGEATCEANPDTVTDGKLRLLRDSGINRLSLGVQTYSPAGLALLRRRHSAAVARAAVEQAAGRCFPRGVNVDLIHSWPGQALADMANDINISIDLGIHHISYYSLIIEDGAPAAAEYGSAGEGDDEAAGRSWDFIEDTLANKGFIHYETSNFSRPGFRCRHNVDVWEGGEYYGIGAAAHSHVAGRRFANVSDIEKYIQCSTTPARREAFSERLRGEAKARECAVFWLRLYEGVDVAVFRERTGYDFFELYRDVVPALLAEGVMESVAGRVRVAAAYQPVLDSVLAELV